MIRFVCKDWLLYVDLEATKEYYCKFSQKTCDNSNQLIQMNYQKYCETLSEKENHFFDSLGITPSCCDVDSLGINKKGKLSVWGQYRVKGTYGHIMEDVVISAEEFVEKKLYLEKNQSKLNNGLHVGNFGITFLYKGSMFHPYPEDLEEGWIVFDFFIEEIPWLLDEPCPLKEYEPLHWWQFRQRYERNVENKKAQIASRNHFIFLLEAYCKKQKIRFIRVEESRAEGLKRHWFSKFAPSEISSNGERDIDSIERFKKAKKVCFSKPNEPQNFLWHLFSFELVDAKVGEEAITSMKEYASGYAWIFTQFDSIIYKIDHAERFDVEQFLSDDSMWLYSDFYIMAADGSWTYAHTHEEEFGPYFYKVR